MAPDCSRAWLDPEDVRKLPKHLFVLFNLIFYTVYMCVLYGILYFMILYVL